MLSMLTLAGLYFLAQSRMGPSEQSQPTVAEVPAEQKPDQRSPAAPGMPAGPAKVDVPPGAKDPGLAQPTPAPSERVVASEFDLVDFVREVDAVRGEMARRPSEENRETLVRALVQLSDVFRDRCSAPEAREASDQVYRLALDARSRSKSVRSVWRRTRRRLERMGMDMPRWKSASR